MKNLKYNENYSKVTEILLKLGIKPKLVGFDYLRDAVLLFNDNSQYKLKDMYEIIAEKYDTKTYSVEKAIRNAITCAFNIGGLLTVNEFYDSVIYNNSEKYTNFEMITLICEIINMKNPNQK